ncbi:alpha/beta hydrolase [Herbiconiux sp. KACC 21604]|uniref:alpha/beta fold hydrolase n=1 Tax=unclassified Herbiconiux TaxID=2618217 RepID=UPI001491C251|nr:alpha/beta hydrolase [Herbiconiux sp. SALV-R1]QJU54884.1 alpha/beta hydrolase [Herbiconiux sp. SALV-R1]WPO86007.1 alpha/beta hydrolase [Herbiconiux sp. KACC 21604]
MNVTVVFVAGFWLQGSSWDETVAPLRDAGYTVLTPTLSGLHSVEEDRSDVSLATHVAEVRELVESIDPAEQVVLVGHSGGGSIIHAVVDALPGRIARAIYVDSWPTADGIAINAELPADGDSVPLPDWDAFGEVDLRDLDDELRERFRQITVPQPVRVARDEQRLSDPARHDVPITLIATTFTRDDLDGYIASGHPMFAEFPPATSVTVIELPTGHWPQFTKPHDLSEALLSALPR